MLIFCVVLCLLVRFDIFFFFLSVNYWCLVFEVYIERRGKMLCMIIEVCDRELLLWVFVIDFFFVVMKCREECEGVKFGLFVLVVI